MLARWLVHGDELRRPDIVEAERRLAAANARVAIGCELSESEQEAGVEVVTWAPTQESWGDGDRTGLCVAHRAAAFTGSLLDGTADLD